VPRPTHELPRVAERAADDQVELLLRLPRLDAILHDGRVVERQLAYRLSQESHFLLVGVEQRDLHARACERERDTGESRTAANIERPLGIADVRDDREAVEQVPADDLVRAAYGGKVIDAVPLLEQIGEREKALARVPVESQAELLEAAIELLLGIGGGRGL